MHMREEVHSSAGKNPSFFTPFTVTSPRTPSAATATAIPAGIRTATPPKTQSTLQRVRSRRQRCPDQIDIRSAEDAGDFSTPEHGGHHPRICIAKQDRLFDPVSGTRARF